MQNQRDRPTHAVTTVEADEIVPAPKPGQKGFRPANAGKSRDKGVPNKTTKALKEAILLAAEQSGYEGKGTDGLVGYLRRLADKEPRVFGSLLGKVLPLEVRGDATAPVTIQVVRWSDYADDSGEQ